ncbi:hypothetical protein SHKM778_56520 [Streptomyces sp. KM77-8]|uniref:Thiamine pyrophosphate enzyme central domain-containing protein n=1 Tax=Streptomyces haneummycinicus TaxID=3074435 RepID=A0AAT9HQ00_9ACTN
MDTTGIPVASTQAGKGSLRHDHSADLGGIGHTGTAVSDELARTADLVIGVGTRYSDFTTASGTLFRHPDVRFLNLNITGFDAHKLAARTLVGDARTSLEQLAGALAGHRVEEPYGAEYRAGKERWERIVETAFRVDDDTAVPTQTQVLGALDAVVGDEDVVINAAGSLPGDLHKLWRARSPPVPPGVRLLLHGLRDPGRPRCAAGRARHTRVGAGRRRHVSDEPDGDRHRRPGEPPGQPGPGAEPRVRVHRRPVGVGGRGALRHRLPSPGRRRLLHRRPAARGPRRERGQPRHGRPARQDRTGAARRAGRGAGLRPSDVRVHRDRPRRDRSPAEAWWDVPVAEVSAREAAVEARTRYDAEVAGRRRHL